MGARPYEVVSGFGPPGTSQRSCNQTGPQGVTATQPQGQEFLGSCSLHGICHRGSCAYAAPLSLTSLGSVNPNRASVSTETAHEVPNDPVWSHPKALTFLSAPSLPPGHAWVSLCLTSCSNPQYSVCRIWAWVAFCGLPGLACFNFPKNVKIFISWPFLRSLDLSI